jgi:hypothetical protein
VSALDGVEDNTNRLKPLFGRRDDGSVFTSAGSKLTQKSMLP